MKLDQTKKVLVASLGLLTVADLAIADDISSGHSGLENMEQPQVAHIVQVNPGFTYNSDADFDNKSLGKVNVWRFDVPARYTMKTEAGDLGLGAFYEFSEYEFKDFGYAGNTVGNKEFNTFTTDAFWKGMYDDEWGYFVYGSVSLSSATSVGLGTGLTGIGGGGVRYVWSPNLSLGLGAAVATHMEDDPSILPIIALNWQINDRWNLRTLMGATLTYDITADKKWQADLALRYQRREYRIAKDVSATDKMFSGEVGATYRFCPNAALRGFVGVAAGRSIELRYNGDSVRDENVDASPFFGVRALFTF